jgi:hypothetical protein
MLEADKKERAIVVTPFFYSDMSANRPLSVACALSQFAEVDVITADFSHSTKKENNRQQVAGLSKVIHLKTPRYDNNVGFGRLYSHFVFSLRAAALIHKMRDRYDILYVTLPLNLLAWFALRSSRAKRKIVDILDVWPDSLPFSARARRAFAPLFRAWKWFFKQSVMRADLVLAVSDKIKRCAAEYAHQGASVERFYLGHEALASKAPKQPRMTLAYIGNLGWLYDFDTLLDVLSDEDIRARVQLFVIGKGDRQQWLIHELEARQIAHRFYGVVFDARQLADILCSCHMGFNGYINTTAAFSYKASSYLAAGLPILNSMHGDLEELVTEYGLGFNYRGGDRANLRSCFAQINEVVLASMSQNCKRFFAAEIERGKVRENMTAFLRGTTI